MPADTTALANLKVFLNKLFQFESQDLDFGIYRILNIKSKEIKAFIDTLLTNKVKEQLQVFDATQSANIKAALQELEADETVQNYNTALAANPAEAEVLYKYQKAKIDAYLKTKKQVADARRIDNTEESIYNHLTLFFSRYYDKGDFISKRRYGKTEKYIVPYNGEETHFYWANHDQYYIKSSEYFQNFAFKVPHLQGTLTVNFKLADAQTEQGNVKAEDNKYFLLSQKPAELHPHPVGTAGQTAPTPAPDATLTIYIEYRSLTEAEKKTFTGNGKQDTLNERAAAQLKTELAANLITNELWKEDDKQQSLLLRKLHHYTRKNSYDFFIHKNLQAFLQRELDFYIKSELVNVEDLYVLDSEQHFENIRHNFKLIKCFKNIADTIIDFLAQIEDFQKQLWEKKKFVLRTEWVVTLDKLAAWLEAPVFESIALELLQNEQQLAEWKSLFRWESLPFALTVDGLKANLHTWRKLPVDTKHFAPAFKDNLLNVLSEKIHLEDEANGLLIHSDNYHGLQLLQEKFKEQVKCVYIDPPYNTGSDGFLYKDGFKHGAWLTMINNKLQVSKPLLPNDGVYFTSIDDEEQTNLTESLNRIFGKENFVANIIWQKKYSPQNDAKWLSDNHDFILCTANDKSVWRPTLLPRTDEQNDRYFNPDNDARGDWKPSGLDVRTYSSEYDYPITTPSGRIVKPPKGICWRYSKERLEELIKDNRIWFGDNGDNVPAIKRFL